MIQPFSRGLPCRFLNILRNVLFLQDTRPDGIVTVVMDIGDLVGKPDDPPLQRGRIALRLVVADAVSHLKGQIQPLPVLFQHIHGAHALFAVLKSVGTDPVQRALSCMAEGRMSKIMPQSDGFHQILVQPERLCDGSGVLRNFQRMRQSRAVMVALRRQEHLGLILQSAECLAVQNSVPVPLKDRPDVTGLLILKPSQGILAQGGVGT